MEVWRHISSGRLSELFGSSTLSEDRFIRTLGWRQAAERDLAALSPDARAALDAYAAGVNAWIADHHGSLSLPFVVTGLKSGLGGFGGYDAGAVDGASTRSPGRRSRRGSSAATSTARSSGCSPTPTLGDPARTDELFPPYDPAMPVITPSGLKGSGGAGATAAAAPGAATARPRPRPPRRRTAPGADVGAGRRLARPRRGAATGSSRSPASTRPTGSPATTRSARTTWSSGRRRPTTKTALLANDPHLGIGMPSVWYMNGLRCRVVSAACPCDVAGVSFPGVPGVVLGHNAQIAWGATNVDPDVEDLFSIEPDPNDPAALPRRRRVGAVRGPARDDQGRRRRAGRARRPDDARRADPQRRRQPPEGRAAARPALDRDRRRSTGRSRRSSTSTRRRPSTSSTRRSRRTARRPRTSSTPTSTGHIGYVLPGRIPIRADADGPRRPDPLGQRRQARLDRHDPVRGPAVAARPAERDDRDREQRRGRRPVPVLRRRRSGIPATGRSGSPTCSTRRPPSGGVSTDTLRAIQIDTDARLRAERVVPHLVDGRPSSTRATARSLAEPDPELVDARLPARTRASAARPTRRSSTGWSAACSTTSSAPLAREYVGGGASLAGDDRAARPAGLAVVGRRHDDRSDGDARRHRRPRPSTRPARELRAAYGDPASWTWGRLHQARFEEATLGSSGIGPLEWYFDKGPFAGAGRRRRGRTTPTTGRRAAYPDPDDPSYVPVGHRRRLRRHEPAVVPAVDRHGGPGRRADRPDDRPERQPVRPPLRRPDRPVAGAATPSRCRSRRRRVHEATLETLAAGAADSSQEPTPR